MMIAIPRASVIYTGDGARALHSHDGDDVLMHFALGYCPASPEPPWSEVISHLAHSNLS